MMIIFTTVLYSWEFLFIQYCQNSIKIETFCRSMRLVYVLVTCVCSLSRYEYLPHFSCTYDLVQQKWGKYYVSGCSAFLAWHAFLACSLFKAHSGTYLLRLVCVGVCLSPASLAWQGPTGETSDWSASYWVSNRQAT